MQDTKYQQNQGIQREHHLETPTVTQCRQALLKPLGNKTSWETSQGEKKYLGEWLKWWVTQGMPNSHYHMNNNHSGFLDMKGHPCNIPSLPIEDRIPHFPNVCDCSHKCNSFCHLHYDWALGLPTSPLWSHSFWSPWDAKPFHDHAPHCPRLGALKEQMVRWFFDYPAKLAIRVQFLHKKQSISSREPPSDSKPSDERVFGRDKVLPHVLCPKPALTHWPEPIKLPELI